MKSSAFSETPFEKLEPRQLRSVSSPVPEDGNDYHLALDYNGAVVVSSSAQVAPRAKLSAFQWFDGTADHGIIANGGTAFQGARCDGYYMWPQIPGIGADHSGDASESEVRILARQVVQAGYKLVVIDNETWGFDIRYHTRAEVDSTIARMKQVLAWVRDEEPSLKIGIYGYMSQSDDSASTTWPESQRQIATGHEWYTASLPDYANAFARWQATSEYLRPLSQSVDYVFPALYTGVSDPAEWKSRHASRLKIHAATASR